MIRAAQAIALAAVVALIAVPAVLADDTTATANVSGGSLTESTASTPSVSATLNGTNQTPTYTMDIDVNDPTGTGNGWNLTITSTRFATAGGKFLSNSASQVTGVGAVCAQGTCTDPTNSISYPLTVPAGASAPAPVKLFNAAADTGMGEFTVTPTVGVSIPANTYAGTYTSTLTLAAVSAP